MRLVLVLLSLSFAGSATAEDRTLAEFRKYAADKLSGLSDAKLDAIVKRVDANGDGVISDDEFAKRLPVFRAVKSGAEPWMSDLDKAREVASRTGRPLLIFARADWCAACQSVEKTSLVDPDVQLGLSAFVLLKLDVDKQGDAAKALNIRALPTFLIEDSRGEQLAKRLGAMTPRPMIKWLGLSRSILAATAEARNARTLRVLTYNIHHGAGVDGKLDLERIAAVITRSKADIVALQEVDRKTSRTGQVDQARELARLTKMNVQFGPNIKFGGGDYGNAVLSKHRITLWKNHALPNIDNGEQRGVLDVELQTKSGPVRLLATHLDHRRADEERVASAKLINKLLASQPKVPSLLAGDLNATPDSQPLRILRQGWALPKKSFPTTPVGRPTRQIDYVLAAPSERVKIVETTVLPESIASDHRGLLSVVEVLPEPVEKESAEPAARVRGVD